MAIEGSLDLFSLADIMQVIAQQGKTGILTLQGERDIVAVSFSEGRIVAADSLNQTVEEALGEVLSGQGLVSPSDFAAAAREHQAGAGRLVDLLVEHGYLERHQVLEALRFHTYRALVDLLAWKSGDFKFYSGDEVSYESGFEPLSVEEFLFRSAEETAGEGHPTIPDSWSLYVQGEVSKPVRVRKEDEVSAAAEDSVLVVTEFERRLLDLLATPRSVSDLVERTDSNEYRVRYSLHRLLASGAVRTEVPSQPPDFFAETEFSTEEEEKEERPLSEVVLEDSEVPAVPTSPIRVPAKPRDVPKAPQLGLGAQASMWVARGLALLLLLAAARSILIYPLSVILPFPWQSTQREQLDRGLRLSLYSRIDRSTKGFYLVQDHFPSELTELTNDGLLRRADLRDAAGRPLRYSSLGASYIVEATSPAGTGLPGTRSTEATAGDFFLDHELLSLPDQDQPPLVLLD